MRRLMIDAAALKENIETVKAAAGAAAVYSVLKADGYGLGLAPMARVLSGRGIDRFAVTEPTAACALAAAGLPVREILMLRPVLAAADIEALLRLGTVTFSVGSPEEAVALARAGTRLGVRPRAHIQIDTGLGRYGFRWDDPYRLRFLYESFTAVRFTGIYTHFADARRAGRVRRQFRRFRSVLARLEEAGIDPGTRHCCASSALLRHPEMRLDGVRIGSAFLGRVPAGERFGLRSICWCEATAEAVRSLPAGASVGYGARYRALRDMRIAVVDLGAVHGLGAGVGVGRQRPLAGLSELAGAGRKLLRGGGALRGEVNGAAAPVLGRPCAECAILDVTDADCAPGDIVRFSLNPMYCRDVERVWQNANGHDSAFDAEKDVCPVA